MVQKQEQECKPAISAAARRWERALLLVRQANYRGNKVSPDANPDLLVVSPAIDGRLKDEGKESTGE